MGVMKIRRIALPSGGWWDIRTRPTWSDAGCFGDDESSLDRQLVAISERWAFDEPVSLGTIACRDEDDLAAVLTVIQEDVLPWLEQDSPDVLSMSLFQAMAVGEVPEGFFEIQLMAATGWSWQALQSTPADVVMKMALFLAVSHIREQGGTL
jgi:hypothetical protein